VTRRAALAMLLVLCACSTTEWVREDRNAEETDKDIVDCTRYAQREASNRAAGFYGPSYAPPGAYGTRNRMLDEAGLTDYCMRSKGYRLQPKQ
jgi:hypothetical protein